tara:strand:+ start:356 stop:613 length:258 start_codon:yes stop_codon:yes gene_type:complete
MTNPPVQHIERNIMDSNTVTSIFNIGIFYLDGDGSIRNLSEDKDSQENKDNIFIDLSNLIFDIREKISDIEYKDIMETMSKLKNI